MNYELGTLLMNNRYIGMIVASKHYYNHNYRMYKIEWYYKGKAYTLDKWYDDVDIKIFIHALEKYEEDRRENTNRSVAL